jgi:mono/diheme cytochrome c family protein
MRKVVLGACVLMGLLVLSGGSLSWFLHTHSFSARDKPLALEAWVARHLRRLAFPPGARTMHNPLTPSPLDMAEARDHFADHCAVCHNHNGDGKTIINEGLYPPAPDLRQAATQDLSDGELFFIIQQGIRFTGMPGWGGDDAENWKLVAFIRHLPALSQQELELMLKK